FVTGELFGLDVPFVSAGGKQASFVPTAFLFFIFALPLFVWVREARVMKPKKATVAQAYREVWQGVRDTRKYQGVLRFLIADYFFEDAVATVVINIGLYCSIVIGLAEQEISAFLIISTVSAVIGSFVIGKIAQHWSLKYILTIIVWGWVGVLILFVFTDSMTVVWILGSLVGILFGGLWTTSRPMLAELVPREDLGRFFGLFSLSGRAAAVVGPLVWTTVVYLFNANRALGRAVIDLVGIESVNAVKLPYKVGVLSLAVMMVIGLYIFRKVPHTGKRMHGQESR
ncbi:MAG: MFS transporter, partial [Candidatus Zixiibacteriota bacterium]